jgi:hypothetical protein
VWQDTYKETLAELPTNSIYIWLAYRHNLQCNERFSMGKGVYLFHHQFGSFFFDGKW